MLNACGASIEACVVTHSVCLQSDDISYNVQHRLVELESRLKQQVAIHEHLLSQLQSVRQDLQNDLAKSKC